MSFIAAIGFENFREFFDWSDDTKNFMDIVDVFVQGEVGDDELGESLSFGSKWGCANKVISCFDEVVRNNPWGVGAQVCEEG